MSALVQYPVLENCSGWVLLSWQILPILYGPAHLPLPPSSLVETITPPLNHSALDFRLSWDAIAPTS